MKDRQVEQSPPQMRIPFVSAALHCVSMTVIVLLRSSFGFVYLRPKSVFFAFSWAFALFFIYAWYEKAVWAEYRILCLYGVVAVSLYFVHLLTAFFRELYRGGEHDHDSGTPHTIRLLRVFGRTPTPLFEMNWHLWVEPLVVLFSGLALRFVFGEHHLAIWLMAVAPCLSLKEALNYWFQIRQKKGHIDARSDAKDIFEDVPSGPKVEPPKPVGKQKVRRPRASESSASEEIKERQFEQVLRLLRPYSLEDAEQNYRKLIKQYHPDPNQAEPENTVLSAELNEAIAYFRAKLG